MTSPIDRLNAIMAQLRTPVGGCPWDVEQTFRTIAPYTIEEAYEVADAIERGDMNDLKSELGDLLFQVVFHSRMAEEQGLFAFDDVAEAMSDKLERRHPHVFGDEAAKPDGVAQKARWEDIKAAERASKAQHGVLDDVPVGLPALARAAKLTKRAARVGFDWPSTAEVLDKLDEEVAELKVEIEAGDLDKARDELGDLLFVMANLARKLGVEPEDALRGANAKFVRRFGFIEAELAKDGRTPDQSDLAEMDALWDAAKGAERA
ncbi:nucleoside triphosphate pyrophosphohydrolase [Brevundimonas sp. NPDC092305]|uniref:nucleoside triphosphate pyrophosphohydrolase n=1 Tax=Brevundimonas sp. NPDC092305 TaxID=3363957 RepID=UPI0037FEDF18